MPKHEVTVAALKAAVRTKLERVVAKWAYTKAKEGQTNVHTVLNEVVREGCSSGIVPFLIYYKDTTRFYNKYKHDIWTMIANNTEEGGYKSVFDFLSYRNHGDPWDCDQVENFLARFGFEEAARKILDRLESSSEEKG